MGKFSGPFLCISDHHFYWRPLNARSVIVDLGANLGYFSNGMHDLFRCRCYMVEPGRIFVSAVPENEYLIKYHAAIAGVDGRVAFNDDGWHQGNKVSKNTDGAAVVGDHLVKAVTLESFLREQGLTGIVDLLKVDVEGAEIEMFLSAPDDVLKRIKQVTIEFHDFLPGADDRYRADMQRIIVRMKSLGFRCLRFCPNNYSDCLFIRLRGREKIIFDFLVGIKKLKSLITTPSMWEH